MPAQSLMPSAAQRRPPSTCPARHPHWMTAAAPAGGSGSGWGGDPQRSPSCRWPTAPANVVCGRQHRMAARMLAAHALVHADAGHLLDLTGDRDDRCKHRWAVLHMCVALHMQPFHICTCAWHHYLGNKESFPTNRLRHLRAQVLQHSWNIWRMQKLHRCRARTTERWLQVKPTLYSRPSLRVSSALVASSSRASLGAASSRRAKASRCCSPSDNIPLQSAT